jgi:hypothetical protein
MIASFLVFASESAWAAPDISGIAVGEDYATAKAAIMKINPSYKFDDIVHGSIMGGNQKIIGTLARIRKAGVDVDRFGIMKNNSDVVWFVTKTQRFEAGSRPQYNSIYSSLREKYGKNMDVFSVPGNSNIVVFMLQIDQQGKVYSGPANQGPCHGMQEESLYDDDSFLKPVFFPPKCGIFIRSIMLKDNDGMVSTFSISISDAKIMHDGLPPQAAQERERQLNAEKAKNIKPSF